LICYSPETYIRPRQLVYTDSCTQSMYVKCLLVCWLLSTDCCCRACFSHKAAWS